MGAFSKLFLDQFDRSVVVAVTVVRVVQVAVHQVADVVSVGNGFVATARAVHVIGRVAAADMVGGTAVRILGRNFDGVMLHGATILLVVKMTVVQIVDVVTVLDGGVATALTVIVIVMIALMVVSHE